jgi:lysophospholipase L1-like esterase
VRVLTLGASSTFGFYDRDNETYPYYLQQFLNQHCISGPEFEVINFGIPHASSRMLATLFLNEGLPLNPDVVTFYQGRNDSVVMPEYKSVFEKHILYLSTDLCSQHCSIKYS